MVMRKILFLLTGILLLSGCLNKEQTNNTASFVVKAVLPESFGGLIDMTKISVQIQSTETPIIYRTFFNADGVANFTIEPGRCRAVVSSRTPDGIFNGLVSEFLPTSYGIIGEDKSNISDTLYIKLEVAAPGGIVFREIYYVGSRTPLGAGYTKDQFVELYNNTDMVFYLDSLCLGVMNPANGIAANNPWLGRDTIALFQAVWIFPGTGQDYPLGPGESAVIAWNAINHATLCTSNFNFSKAHFAIYDPLLTGHEKHPDVPALIRKVPGGNAGTAYSLSVNSPAVVLYRPEMGVQRYLDDAATWERFTPGQTTGTKYWHIAKEWIIDGVDCSNGPTIGNKRFPVSVDAGFAYTVGANSFQGVRRKIEQVLPTGRIIYQDTNNSSVDFEMNVTPSPRIKP